jgi:hypothetical protein
MLFITYQLSYQVFPLVASVHCMQSAYVAFSFSDFGPKFVGIPFLLWQKVLQPFIFLLCRSAVMEDYGTLHLLHHHDHCIWINHVDLRSESFVINCMSIRIKNQLFSLVCADITWMFFHCATCQITDLEMHRTQVYNLLITNITWSTHCCRFHKPHSMLHIMWIQSVCAKFQSFLSKTTWLKNYPLTDVN